MLQFLTVGELAKLSGVCKEIKKVIKEYLENKKSYRADLSCWRLQAEKSLKLLPNLTHLTLVLPHFYSFEHMFTPSLKSITLELGVNFQYRRGRLSLHSSYWTQYKNALKTIRELLEKDKLGLNEIHIVLSNDITVYQEYETGAVSDYDEYGPIYETDIVEVTVNTFDPIHYWLMADYLTDDEVSCIVREILSLLAANKNQWKKITYPYDFFGASKIEQLFPQTKTTNWFTESEETIYKHLESVLDEEFKKLPEYQSNYRI